MFLFEEVVIDPPPSDWYCTTASSMLGETTGNMIGGSAHWVDHTRRRLLAAGAIAVAAAIIPFRIASAATLSDTASAIVTLDAPGTVTVDAFDPAQGTLTSVQVSLRVDVLVQVCIENTGETTASMAGGSATASLEAEFPGGTNPTVATVDASVDPVSLPASNGTADCADGLDDATDSFPAPVTAADTTYFEQADQSTGTSTITDTTAMAPFIGTGTVAVAYTPASDTELVLPADWDNISVAVGQVSATVTYTYTPAGAGPLPPTDVIGNQIAAVAPIASVAIIAVLVGVVALVAADRWRRRRTPPPTG
jgi:hypothetical protein